MKLKRLLVGVGLAFFVCSQTFAQDSQQKTEFEEPVVLMLGSEVLNVDNAMMYPSPAIFDVDSDGKDELVIGTIFGEIFACENEADDAEQPVWKALATVNDSAGEPLSLNNW